MLMAMTGVIVPRYHLKKGAHAHQNENFRRHRLGYLRFIRESRRARLISSKESLLRASSAGFPESDPYQVLGVSSKTSSDNIQRAYRTKLQEAKTAGDEAQVTLIEQAHSSIMMQQLTQRMQGQVNREIAYADKAVYFPWRPRVAIAERKLQVITIAVQLALWLYAFAAGSTTGTQPAIGSALACAGVTYFKLEALFPSQGGVAFSADEGNRKQGAKNLIRCVLLAIMGTTIGIVLFFTLPDLVSNIIFHKPLPFWVYDNQEVVVNSGVILMNLILSLFFR